MKLNFKSPILLTLLGLVFSTYIQGKDYPFSYLEAQFAHIQHSDISTQGNLGIELALPIFDNWFIIGNRTVNDFTQDTLGIEMEYTHWLLGGGYFWTLSESNDLYLQVSAETQRLENRQADEGRRGASIELGSLYNLSDNFDLNIHARYSDINISKSEDRENEFYFGGRLDYKLSPDYKVSLGYEIGDFDRLDVSVRFNF